LNNGFKIEKVGESLRLNDELKNEMKDNVDKALQDKFNEFKLLADNDNDECYDINCNNDEILNDDSKYKRFESNVKLLKLPFESDKLDMYQDVICNDHVLSDHLNLITMLKTDAYVDEKIKSLAESNMNVKTVDSRYQKIKMTRYLEGKIGIGKLELDKIDVHKYDHKIVFDDAMYKLFKVQFKTEKNKPVLYKDLVKMYIGAVKHMIGSIKLISTTRGTDRKHLYTHSINDDVLNYHLSLHKFKNYKHKK
jgi:hypothetical protein